MSVKYVPLHCFFSWAVAMRVLLELYPNKVSLADTKGVIQGISAFCHATTFNLLTVHS
jgi:hypothetical protein